MGRRIDVYDSWSTEREVRCVVKVVRPDRGAEPHTSLLLEREGRLLCRLAHPHLVRGYEVLEDPRSQWCWRR